VVRRCKWRRKQYHRWQWLSQQVGFARLDEHTSKQGLNYWCNGVHNLFLRYKYLCYESLHPIDGAIWATVLVKLPLTSNTNKSRPAT
jgi:hypothetical protein